MADDREKVKRADFVVLDILDFTLQPRVALTSNVVHAMRSADDPLLAIWCLWTRETPFA